MAESSEQIHPRCDAFNRDQARIANQDQRFQVPSSPSDEDDSLHEMKQEITMDLSADDDDKSMPLQMSAKKKFKFKDEKHDKICGVCGDRALGCNFDAVSCESCKAFFRRNALKEKRTKCLFEGSCKIDVNTRRFCPHCRLKKCLLIGMRKDLILGDEERRKRLAKVMQNRAQREGKGSSCSNNNNNSMNGEAHTPSTPVVTSSNLLSLSLGGIQNTDCDSTSTNLFDRDPNGRILTPEETSLLYNLEQVYNSSFSVEVDPSPSMPLNKVNPSLNQLVNQSSITVLRLIKFAKRLDDFINLPQELQIGLLKGAVLHILLLRSASLYDKDRDCWKSSRGDVPTDILKNATGLVQMHKEHVLFCKSLTATLHGDTISVIILLVIVLLSPESPHIVERSQVADLQDKYLVLLKHYLEAKYSYERASKEFPELLMRLRDLKVLAERHGKVLLDVNPTEVEPIMLEILDLK